MCILATVSVSLVYHSTDSTLAAVCIGLGEYPCSGLGSYPPGGGVPNFAYQCAQGPRVALGTMGF